jgi:nucleotide-binding universal stress UspA family protein
MFSNIVWATDGSEHADRALDYATRLADNERARLHVVHIVETIVGGRVAGQRTFLDEDQLDAKISAQADEVSRQYRIETTVHMTPSGISNIADRIAEIATDSRADLIVVGTRGHSPIGGLVLGSVTQRLLHVASCPVLAVPPVKTTPADSTERLAGTMAS